MEYAVSQEKSLDDLVENVNKMIRTGWKPEGGVYSNGHSFMQALTRKSVKARSRSTVAFKIPSEAEVNAFFVERGSTEANRFYLHYTANGWKIGGKSAMANWQAAAQNWMQRAKEYGRNKQSFGAGTQSSRSSFKHGTEEIEALRELNETFRERDRERS